MELYFLLLTNNLKVKVRFLVIKFIYKKLFFSRTVMPYKINLLLWFLEDAYL